MSNDISSNLDFIFGRRSVRVYAPGVVTDDQVKMLLQAAMAAPSAMTKDPWRFLAIRNPGTLSQLAANLPGGKMLSTASLAFVVSGDLDAAFETNIGYLVQDCSAAIENLLLAAHILGLGACWVGVYPSDESCRKLKQMLDLPSSFVPVAAIAIGHPGEHLEPRTRFNPAFLRSERWSA